jgi:Tol biopolymer transport system component
MRPSRRAAVIALLVPIAALAFFLLRPERVPVPAGVAGALVFVSDRSGTESLWIRRLPRGEARPLTATSEAARDPALSPDGGRVAFAMGGRIATVSVATGEVRVLTLGVDWVDASPAWRADGRALVVAARRPDAQNADLHILDLEPTETGLSPRPDRRPLTETRGLDEASPVFAPDGGAVVFVREDGLFRVSLADGRATRLTGGLRKFRQPRFLPSGRLLCLWDQEKLHGLDVMDADGRNRETLWQGTVYYRTIVPSPDGRHLAATFTFDLGFHPQDALKLRQTEEVRLLDARGNLAAVLERSGRHTNHSPDWGK